MNHTPAPSSLCYYNPLLIKPSSEVFQVDLCIYGANAAGVIAAVQASRMGLNVILLEPGDHVGGLTASGLSCTDVGEKAVVGGLSREFYQRCGAYYNTDEEWHFEPHVAEKVLLEMVQESDVPIFFRQYLDFVTISEERIVSILLEGGMRVIAKTFMDCTYEGDLMAKAGVRCHVGREGNAVYQEAYNGVQVLQGHQFVVPVDPYNVAGDPESGLLPGIEDGGLAPTGSGDKRIQAYNFRLCLSCDSDNQIPFEKPDNYDDREYELALRYVDAGYDQPLCLTRVNIRNNKMDMNNKGAVSTDYIGRNYAYPEGDYFTRERIYQAHVTYQKGMLWFWRNDSRVPASSREKIEAWGLAADEFISTGGWPHQLYVREARRMISDYVMTEHHCFHRAIAEDSIGMASYTMDSHNTQRFVRDGKVLNEGNVEIFVEPFAISQRSITPRRTECSNLLVPVCLSASHICYGSVRMEPVFMILAQSAAIIAAFAIKNNCAVQEVNYAELRVELEKEKQILEFAPERISELVS